MSVFCLCAHTSHRANTGTRSANEPDSTVKRRSAVGPVRSGARCARLVTRHPARRDSILSPSASSREPLTAARARLLSMPARLGRSGPTLSLARPPPSHHIPVPHRPASGVSRAFNTEHSRLPPWQARLSSRFTFTARRAALPTSFRVSSKAR